MNKFLVRTLTAAALALVIASPARAEFIDDTGDDFSIFWSFACGGAGTCTGTADFDVTSISATQLGLTITVDNTLVAPGEFLVGFGWDQDPLATSIDGFTAGTFFSQARLDETFPSFQTINVCVDDQTNGSCGSGQPTDGLGAPNPTTDTFSILLGGDFANGVDLSGFALKYAGAFSSWEGPGTVDDVTDNPVDITDVPDDITDNPVDITPEPASLVLLGSGLVAVASRLRRRKTA